MLRKLVYILPLLVCFYSTKGQSKRAIFVGLQVAVTVEPEYEKNEFTVGNSASPVKPAVTISSSLSMFTEGRNSFPGPPIYVLKTKSPVELILLRKLSHSNILLSSSFTKGKF